MNLIYIVLIAVGVLVLFILAGLAIVNKSGEELYDKFNQISKYETSISPIEFANFISKTFFGGQIRICFDERILSDSYSSDGKLTLCSKYANNKQLAGLAIVAHELGHAFQFASERNKMKKYGKKLKLSKILSRLISPLFIIAVALLCFEYYIFAIICAGLAVILFILACSVKMSTIKIENEASLNALELLKTYANFDEHQLKLAEEFLNSAKLTYIADLLKIMLKWTGMTRK
ncbi:MAG: zinc metallopeptidase [Clostridia bacterium]|nr:zinc metallopeptidase [Clostridia bacterium]